MKFPADRMQTITARQATVLADLLEELGTDTGTERTKSMARVQAAVLRRRASHELMAEVERAVADDGGVERRG